MITNLVNKKSVTEVSYRVNEGEQINLAIRKMNLLGIRLMEYDYYRTLSEDKQTRGGFDEKTASVQSASKQALKEIYIILEKLRILDVVDTETWAAIRKKQRKMEERE